jgi:hypothetical protein
MYNNSGKPNLNGDLFNSGSRSVMKFSFKWIFIIISSLTFLSCGKEIKYVNISHAPVSITPDDYKRVLNRWTRKKIVVHKFDTTLDVHATLLSFEFRKAYSVLYNHYFKLSKNEKTKFWKTQKDDLTKYVEFVVAVASTEEEWNDLQKGNPKLSGPGKKIKGSIWKIKLLVDSEDPVYPAEIKLIHPVTKLHKNMFPFIGHFHKFYLIRFPTKIKKKQVMPLHTQKIKLTFSGPLGHATLTWLTTNMYITGK